MQREYGIYGMILRYYDTAEVQPLAYKEAYKREEQQFVEQAVKRYKEYTQKHIKALFQSLRRHCKTKLGSGWEFEILAIPSFHDSNAVHSLNREVLTMLIKDDIVDCQH